MGAGLTVGRWRIGLETWQTVFFKVGAYDVYTEVAKYLDWIEKTILSNGGMAACGFAFSAPPLLG